MRPAALIVVDVQNDFCEGGALAVEGGSAVAKRIANYINAFGPAYDTIVFTRDWHNHWPDTNGGHFSENPDFLDSWPVHCQAGTHGAEFHPNVNQVTIGRRHFYKGMGKPDYSGFQGVTIPGGLPLADYLGMYDVHDIDVAGIAGDYCVRHTALDAKRLGYNVRILPYLVASVGGQDATKRVIEELHA